MRNKPLIDKLQAELEQLELSPYDHRDAIPELRAKINMLIAVEEYYAIVADDLEREGF